MKKRNIFIKLFLVMIAIGLIPVVLFSFFTINGYQELINKYNFYIDENPELLQDIELIHNNIKIQTILIFVLVSIFVVFYSILLTRSFLFPIKKLLKGTKEIRKGNYNIKIDIKTGDEFESLAESFNHMTKNLKQKILEIKKSETKTKEAYDNLKETEKIIVEERNKTSAIIDNFTDPIIVIDKSNKLDLFNPAARDIFGLSEGDLGKAIPDKDNYSFNNFSFLINKKFKVKIKKINNENYTEEVAVNHQNQELIYRINTVKVIDKKGYIGTMKIFYNITREKMIDKIKSDFISIAAHQLRTPLSAIKWAIGLVLDQEMGKLNKMQKITLEKGYLSNERIIDLINDMLNVSRIEEGRFGYNFADNDFAEALKIVLDSLENKIKQKNIKLRLEGVKDLPLIYMDNEKILLVLQNLVENAVKYTPAQGRIKIKAEIKKNKFYFSIEDNGVGIPENDQKKLFSKFFRASNVMRMQTDGSGLGLFIVKNIINKHGGEIKCKSEEGTGTTFSFFLPLSNK